MNTVIFVKNLFLVFNTNFIKIYLILKADLHRFMMLAILGALLCIFGFGKYLFFGLLLK